MNGDDLARRQRAVRRANRIALHKARLGDRERDFSPVGGVEGISLLTQLSRESWSLSGQDPGERRGPLQVRFVQRSQQ